MAKLPDEIKQKVVQILKEKGVTLTCPRCGNKAFTLQDGYVHHALTNNINTVAFGGNTIPSVITVCNNCGFISLHALGALGLLQGTEADHE